MLLPCPPGWEAALLLKTRLNLSLSGLEPKTLLKSIHVFVNLRVTLSLCGSSVLLFTNVAETALLSAEAVRPSILRTSLFSSFSTSAFSLSPFTAHVSKFSRKPVFISSTL